MDLRKEKKRIYIDREALSVLEMLQEGILSPVTSLMNEEQAKQVNQSGLFMGCSFPSPLIFAPSGRKNQEVIQTFTQGEEVDLFVSDERVGFLRVQEVFRIDKEERIRKIMGGDLGNIETERVYRRIGDYAIYGEFEVIGYKVSQNKKRIQDKIRSLRAKKICGVMLNANPIHKVHEKILEETLFKHDLLVIFVPHHSSWFLPFSLRIESLEYVIKNFLPFEKILIVPLDYTYLLAGQNRMILNALICKNYGCTDFIASLGSSDLGIFCEGDRTFTIMDSIQGIDLSIQLLSEYIFCNQCNTIRSTKICPHGKHHHISYDSRNLFEMLKLGIMPPEVFIRKEVSAMILAHLFPSRIKNLNKLYSDLVSQEGVVEESERRFYENLSGLYHVR